MSLGTASRNSRYWPFHRFLGVALRQLRLIGLSLNHFVVAHQRQGRKVRPGGFGAHVVAIGNAEVGIKALLRRQKLGLKAEVPLADSGRRIALLLRDVAQRHFVGMQTDFAIGKQHTGDRDPRVVATGQQAGPRHRADRCRVKAGELHPLRGELIEVRRVDLGVAKRADVGVAHVVDKNQHDIRRPLGSVGTGCSDRQQQQCERSREELFHHSHQAREEASSTGVECNNTSQPKASY